MELNKYKEFLAERKAGLYNGYKYPNLVELELCGNLYLEYFADVTTDLVMAVFRGQEDFTEEEIWKVAHFNHIKMEVLICPKLIYMDTRRWKHRCMIQTAIDKYNRLLALAEWGNKEAQRHKSFATCEYENFMKHIVNNTLTYIHYLAYMTGIENYLFFAGDKATIRDFKATA